MKTSVIIFAVLAVLGATFAKSVFDNVGVLTLRQTRIFETEILKIIQDLKDKAKEHDPLEEKDVEFDISGYKVKASEVFAINFSDFEVTNLKISILRKVEATIRLPAVAVRVGPFEASSPHGDVFATGVNYGDVAGGGTLTVKATVGLLPVRISKLSFTLNIDGASVDLNGINGDAELTERLNVEANEFLTSTVNDANWQKSVTQELEDKINKVLETILG